MISDVEVAIVRERERPTDNREQAAVVCVRTEAGLVGYGEANAHPAAIKALVEGDCACGGWDRSPRDLLLGEDPRDPRRLWDRMIEATPWSYRSGPGHVARAGIDMALWDLAGKLSGCPSWKLLGEAVNPTPQAYATLWHGDGNFAETVRVTLEALDGALAQGYRAAKVEAMPGNTASDQEIVELVTLARDRVGRDFGLLLDVGYRWTDAAQAARVISALTDTNLTLVEAPFPPELLTEYERLAGSVETPIATGDLLTAYVDYVGLLRSPGVQIVQSGACRTGVSDMLRVAEAAAASGRRFLPWGWCATALTTAANLAVAIVRPDVPLVEYAPPALYPNGHLRNTLFGPEPQVRGGCFELPTRPGLGVDIDPEALVRFRID